jgi:hypothetical protein
MTPNRYAQAPGEKIGGVAEETRGGSVAKFWG